MTWFNTIKSDAALRCPACKEKTLEPKKYVKRVPHQRGRDRGTMECTNCGHVEVFR